MTEDKATPSADAQRLLAECAIASETVNQGLERLANMRGGLPQAVQDEVMILHSLAKQLIEAFENLRDWLHGQYGVTLAGLAGGGTDGGQ